MGRAFGFERPLAGGTKPGWWSPLAALQACQPALCACAQAAGPGANMGRPLASGILNKHLQACNCWPACGALPPRQRDACCLAPCAVLPGPALGAARQREQQRHHEPPGEQLLPQSDGPSLIWGNAVQCCVACLWPVQMQTRDCDEPLCTLPWMGIPAVASEEILLYPCRRSG